jgi:hypothetical protein
VMKNGRSVETGQVVECYIANSIVQHRSSYTRLRLWGSKGHRHNILMIVSNVEDGKDLSYLPQNQTLSIVIEVDICDAIKCIIFVELVKSW